MATEDANIKAVQVKLVLLGEAAVGKSSLVLRFVQDDFSENTSPTIGAAFLTQKCRLENRVVKFEIWDTAGQERFHSLAPMYYRNAQAAVVVYDITKAASLEKAKAWVKELQRQASPNIVIALVGNKLDLVSGEGESSVVPLAGEAEAEGNDREEEAEGSNDGDDDDSSVKEQSKTAKPSGSDHMRQVPVAQAEAYAKESNLLFFEASAKTGQNVGKVFTEIAKTIPLDAIVPKPAAGNTRRSAGNAQQSEDSAQVNLGDRQQAKKGGCC